jgi:hypothetical protein
MFEDALSLDLTLGTLIGLIIMAGIIACGCALLISHRRKTGGTAAPAASQAKPQSQPAAGAENIQTVTQNSQAKAVKKPEPEKAARVKPAKEKKSGGGFFSFSRPKKARPEPAAGNAASATATQPTQAAAAEKDKKAKPVKEKEQKAPKIKAVKEQKTEKGSGFSLFGKKKDKPKENSTKAASAKEVKYTPPSAAPSTAGTTGRQAAGIPEQSPPAEAVQPAQPPQGIAQPFQEIPPPEEERKENEEGGANSVFDLFTDTEGEESEISQFAANFDNVSLDSLLGDCQDVIGRLSKK